MYGHHDRQHYLFQGQPDHHDDDHQSTDFPYGYKRGVLLGQQWRNESLDGRSTWSSFLAQRRWDDEQHRQHYHHTVFHPDPARLRCAIDDPVHLKPELYEFGQQDNHHTQPFFSRVYNDTGNQEELGTRKHKEK